MAFVHTIMGKVNESNSIIFYIILFYLLISMCFQWHLYVSLTKNQRKNNDLIHPFSFINLFFSGTKIICRYVYSTDTEQINSNQLIYVFFWLNIFSVWYFSIHSKPSIDSAFIFSFHSFASCVPFSLNLSTHVPLTYV